MSEFEWLWRWGRNFGTQRECHFRAKHRKKIVQLLKRVFSAATNPRYLKFRKFITFINTHTPTYSRNLPEGLVSVPEPSTRELARDDTSRKSQSICASRNRDTWDFVVCGRLQTLFPVVLGWPTSHRKSAAIRMIILKGGALFEIYDKEESFPAMQGFQLAMEGEDGMKHNRRA